MREGLSQARPSPERIAEIRAWAAGEYPDGRKHIPEDVESFTRDLIAEIDAMTEEKKASHEAIDLWMGLYEECIENTLKLTEGLSQAGRGGR